MRMLLVSTYEKDTRSFIKPQGGQIFVKKYLEINNKNINVDIIDPQIDNLDYVKKKFKEHYDYLGFYCTYPTVLNTAELINEAYKCNPNAVYILGGSGVSFPDILSICYADIVIYGEGEKIISNITDIVKSRDDLVKKKDLVSEIHGKFMVNAVSLGSIYYGKTSVGCDNICGTEDLNMIIPINDWEVRLHKKYELWTHNMLQHTYGFPIFISRGCASMGCNFCSSYDWFRSKKGVRYCSVEVAYQLICDIFSKMPNVDEILFEDDNLLSNREWAVSFFDMLKEGIDNGQIKQECKYIIKTRVDLIDEEIIGKLLQLGEIQINVGVESYTENVLYELNKTQNATKYLRLVDKIFDYYAKYGVHFHCYMIFFTPESLMQDLLTTIRLAIRFLCAGIEISCYDSLLVFPGCTFDKRWQEDKRTVNWISVKNPLYFSSIYSEDEKNKRKIEESVELPYDFLIQDKSVNEIYVKSSKVFNWLYSYYWEKYNWKASTSFRIAIVKVLTYLIVINVSSSDITIKQNCAEQIDKLINVIENLPQEKKENMSCDEQVKKFDMLG